MMSTVEAQLLLLGPLEGQPGRTREHISGYLTEQGTRNVPKIYNSLRLFLKTNSIKHFPGTDGEAVIKTLKDVEDFIQAVDRSNKSYRRAAITGLKAGSEEIKIADDLVKELGLTGEATENFKQALFGYKINVGKTLEILKGSQADTETDNAEDYLIGTPENGRKNRE